MQGRDEIALDFSIDDTTGGDREDALVGMSFHVPRETTGYPAEHEDIPSTDVRDLFTIFERLSKLPFMRCQYQNDVSCPCSCLYVMQHSFGSQISGLAFAWSFSHWHTALDEDDKEDPSYP